MSKETKSPIKDLPVRLPGQSIAEQTDKILNEKFVQYYIIFSLTFFMALMEWVKWYCNAKPNPILWTIIALISLVYCCIKLWKLIPVYQSLRLGQIGEEAVGQYLEEKLRPIGYQVLHDILFENFNIDHVVIGPSGVYAVETKTCSKPAKGAASVVYDGQNVTVNGFKPDRDPIVQAKAEAHSLHELLERTTGKKFDVRPVVLYPGWYVENMPANAEVWVLNEKAFPTFVANGKKILPPEDVSLITFHLKRYVIARAQEKQ